MCPSPNGFRDRVTSLYSSKIVDKKEILHTVSNSYLLLELSPYWEAANCAATLEPNTGIYFSSDKVGTVYLV
jgi:hypothetical protein